MFSFLRCSAVAVLRLFFLRSFFIFPLPLRVDLRMVAALPVLSLAHNAPPPPYLPILSLALKAATRILSLSPPGVCAAYLLQNVVQSSRFHLRDAAHGDFRISCNRRANCPHLSCLPPFCFLPGSVFCRRVRIVLFQYLHGLFRALQRQPKGLDMRGNFRATSFNSPTRS